MKKKNNNNRTNTDYFPESTENIMEGARVFSQKASELFNSFPDKVRVTAEAAYEKGTDPGRKEPGHSETETGYQGNTGKTGGTDKTYC